MSHGSSSGAACSAVPREQPDRARRRYGPPPTLRTSFWSGRAVRPCRAGAPARRLKGVMTMIAIPHTGGGDLQSQPRQSAMTDQGGLLAGRTIDRVSVTEPTGAPTAGPGQARPASVLTPAAVATAVAMAARAPSVHNTQPWRFHIAGEVIELHADPDRLLTQIDPAGRELTISCGAALFGLRLGLRQLGYLPAVELWPDPAQPWLVARAWPEGPAALNAVEAELLAAVPHRHTHRGPFTPGEVSRGLLAAMA